jgi:prepilin-type N-terminal cleavage/methylation domain-containing protein
MIDREPNQCQRLPSATARGWGFTLVEILVVIAIIGILVALLLPAVQSAREAARRTQCSNNLRQLGLALQNHHDVRGAFPVGVGSNNGQLFSYPRTTWMMHTFPFLEEGNLHSQFDLNASPGCGGAIWLNRVNYHIVERPIQILYCPSDGHVGDVHNHPDCNASVARGNYAGFFGNIDMGAATTMPRPEHLEAPFQLNRGVSMQMITDGTSKIMMVGECLTGSGVSNYDYRGVHWYDHVGTSQIFTQFGPNSASPDRLYPSWCTKDVNLPELNLPCTRGAGNGLDNMASARSHHPGGVHVVMADVSVQFVSDNVDLATWQALGSIENGETAALP